MFKRNTYLEELGLLTLPEEQNGEGVMIPVNKIFSQGGKCRCGMEKE